MTDAKISRLVAEAVILDRTIREHEKMLADIKRDLIAEADLRPEEQQPTENGGKSLTLAGADGCAATVTFPAPSLKAKIDGEGKAIEKVKAAAGALFARLFLPAVTYKPVPNFREEAAALLGKDANKLIKLCQSESAARVSFETKESEG